MQPELPRTHSWNDTVKWIEEHCVEHHTSWCRGYITRTHPEGYIETYEGRFGRGYKWFKPSWQSTQYHHVTYYILKEEE